MNLVAKNLQNDKACIAQLLRLGLVEGAVQHLDWRYRLYTEQGQHQAAADLHAWYLSQAH